MDTDKENTGKQYWSRWYALVIGVLLALVLLFAWFTNYFS